MTEKVKSGEILDVVWRLEKVAIDLHGKKISEKNFMEIFTKIMLQLVCLLINFKLQEEK